MRHISQNFSCVIQQNHIEFIQTSLLYGRIIIRPYGIHNNLFSIFITMRKSVSNRDNHSDRIQRRVVARHDSTNRTQNQHLTSVGACSASTTHTKIPVIERSRNAGFFCKKECSTLRLRSATNAQRPRKHKQMTCNKKEKRPHPYDMGALLYRKYNYFLRTGRIGPPIQRSTWELNIFVAVIFTTAL